MKNKVIITAIILIFIVALTILAQETSPSNKSTKPNPVYGEPQQSRGEPIDSRVRARYLSPEEIYAGSGLMVSGIVSDVSTRLYDNGMVYTEVTIKLEETWKGNQPGETILVRQPGGTADGVTTVSGPLLSCRKGERWLLGLSLFRKDWWTVFAMTQGSFRIEEGNAIRDYSEYDISENSPSTMVERCEVIPFADIRKRLDSLRSLQVGIPEISSQNKDEPKSGGINLTGHPSSLNKPIEKITPPLDSLRSLQAIQPSAVKSHIPLTGGEPSGSAQRVPFDTLLIIIGSGLFILVVILLLRRSRLKHSGITKIIILLLIGTGSVSYGFLQQNWNPTPSGGSRWNLSAQTPVNFFQNGKVKYRLITAGNFAIPSENFKYAIINAFQTWEDSPNSVIAFTRGSDITTSAYDQDFSVGFTDSSNNTPWGSNIAGVGGQTNYSYDSNYYFVNADISLSRTVSWTTDGSSSNDVEADAVHEIGHAIGIAHSPHSQSMMSYVGPWDPLLPNTSNVGITTGGRRLTTDDHIAANVIYPVISGTWGSIRGNITQGVTNVDAALVAVFDSTGRTVTTSYSKNGLYHIDGIPPGTYTIKFQPVYTTSDLNVDVGSLPWSLTPTVFATDASTDFNGIVVTAGTTTTANASVLNGTPSMRITRAVRKYGASMSAWTTVLRIKRGTSNIIGLAGTGMPEAASGIVSLTIGGGGITITSQTFDGNGGYPADYPLGAGSTTIWFNLTVDSNAVLGARSLTLVTTSGERAILPSFLEVYDEGTLSTVIGGNNPPAGSVNAGETNYVMLQVTVTAGSLEPMRLREWKIDNSGTGSLGNVSDVKVYYDADTNGTVNANDIIIGSGTFSGTSTTIYSAYTVPAGGSRSFLITYDFTGSVVDGATYRAALSELKVWGVDSARPITPTGLPLNGNIQTVNVNVGRPPVLASVGNKSVYENANLNFTLSATDPDVGDTVVYTMVSTQITTGATLNSSSGVFNWTPNYTQSGIYVVTFRVTDTEGLFDEETITITVQKSEPPASSDLVVTAVSTSQINLSWVDNSPNENGFKIERKIGPTDSGNDTSGSSVTYTVITTIAQANITSYSDMGLSAGTTYSYRVSAYNSAGDSEYSNETDATTFPSPKKENDNKPWKCGYLGIEPLLIIFILIFLRRLKLAGG